VSKVARQSLCALDRLDAPSLRVVRLVADRRAGSARRATTTHTSTGTSVQEAGLIADQSLLVS
jgi:hypothetical protein